MNTEEFRNNRFIRNFAKDKWLIFASTGVVMLFSLAYIMLLYKPAYQSEAKVWIKDTSTRSFLAQDRNEPGYFSSLTASGNPVMAQSELLTSSEMERFLADYVTKEEARENQGKVKTDEPNTKEVIKVKTEPNTDIITVQLKWHEPAMAQKMLNAALKRLDDTNLDINRKIYTSKRDYLNKQLADVQKKLVDVREKIKNFQSGHMAVDVDTQTAELVKLRSQLVSQMETAAAASRAHASNTATLSRQMAMTPKQALQAVALGSGNETMVKMRSDLAALKQQYAHDSIKQAPTNPQLVALKTQIDSLEKQLQGEETQTLGKAADANVRIYDSTRANLAQMMNEFQARSAAMGTEAASWRAGIAQVDAKLREMPANRYTLAGLQEEEKTLAMAYDELRQKEIEASIREAEIPSNVFVVDSPSMPEKAAFPTSTHLLLLSALLGLGAGLGLSLLKTQAQDLAESADDVAQATRSKVLGIVPWSKEGSKDSTMFSHNEVAAKHIVSNLHIEADKFGAKVLAFTSTSLKKPSSSSAYHLAQRLAALGQTVAFIDTDFRPSNLFNSVVENTNGLDLTDMILAADLKLRNDQSIQPDEVLNGLMRDSNGIYMALNRHNVANPYDYFANKGFRHIVEALKAQFDWVLIDTPPATLAPEFMEIAHISDGIVLFADKNATQAGLRKVAAQIRQTQTPFLGTIVREQNGRLEQEHELYSNWRGPRKGGGSLIASSKSSAKNLAMAEKKRVEFMGAQIDALTMKETLEYIAGVIDRREKIQHVVVNVAKLMTMRRDRKLRTIVNNCDLINADGAGIVMGAKLLGIDIPERVAGIDLMNQLVGMSSQRNYRIYFLGAEEDVVRDVVTYYRRLYPELQICGYRNGYFKADEEQGIAEKIREARPDILFVAMGSPKKEKFLDQWKEVMDVPFVMGVGGSFDVMAGKVKRAPQWMQNAGLEWFYRFAQEPGRMWKRYLVTNTEFGLALVGQAVTKTLRPAHG